MIWVDFRGGNFQSTSWKIEEETGQHPRKFLFLYEKPVGNLYTLFIVQRRRRWSLSRRTCLLILRRTSGTIFAIKNNNYFETTFFKNFSVIFYIDWWQL